jgi:hypothetical protein
MDDASREREILHEAIIESLTHDGDGKELPDGRHLIGWVCIAEWLDNQGERWLSSIGGDARGMAPPMWQVDGYLHNMLFGASNESS